MPSQQSQDSSPLGPLCMPLLKLSYATVAADSISPIPWTHLSSKHNLFAVLETVRNRDFAGQIVESQVFKILRDPEIVENIDLEKLAVAAKQALVEAQDPNVRDKVPKIAIIVKVPVLAIRYLMDDGQVRRFQIRFATEEHYYEMMKTFSRAKVPFSDAGTVSLVRPTTAQATGSTSLTPNDSIAQLGNPQTTSYSRSAVLPNFAPTIAGGSSALAPSDPFGGPPSYGSVKTTPESPFDSRPANFSNTAPSRPVESRFQRDVNAYEARLAKESLLESKSVSVDATVHQGQSLCRKPQNRLSASPGRKRTENIDGIYNPDSFTHAASQPPRDQPNMASDLNHPEDLSRPSAAIDESSAKAPKRKRAPAKKATDTSTAKKPRASASRKKPTPAKSEATSASTVSELLGESKAKAQQVSDRVKPLDRLRDCQTNDNEVATVMGKNRKPSSYGVDETPGLDPGHSSPLRDMKASPTLLQCKASYEVGADKFSNNLGPGISAHRPIAQLDSNIPPVSSTHPAFSKNKAIQHPGTTEPPTLPMINAAHLASTPTSHTLPTTSTLAHALLHAQPAFQPTTVATTSALGLVNTCTAWADLPYELKHESLETYICKQLQDPTFLELCKVMEGTYVRMGL